MPIARNDETGEVVRLTDDGRWEKTQTAIHPQTKQMLAFDGKGWVDVPAKSKGVLGYVDDAVRSLASGVTFGYADELAAKMDELTGRGGSYSENLLKEQHRDSQIPGIIKIPGEVAGAVGSAVAASPVTGTMAAATGLSKLPMLAKSIGVGTAGGGLFGSGNADPGERIAGAATGAALGGVAGAVTPYLLRGASSLVDQVRGAVSPKANVAADLSRAILRDNDTPEALLQRTSEAGNIRPGVATVADVGGENVKGLVERIAQTPGAGRTQVIPALTGRQQSQIGRISSDLTGLTGTSKSAYQAVSETMEQRAKDAKPIYDEAFNFNARAVPEIVREWTLATADGFGKAFMQRPEFRRTLQTEYGIKDPDLAPLMVQIDVWKKVADDYVRDNLGKNSARVVEGMRNRVLGVVDEFNPKYAEARNAWAGPSRYLDAIDEGRNIFSTNVTAEQLHAGLKAMPAAEREGFIIGAVSTVINKMRGDPAKLGDMTKYLRSPEMRGKIAALMPDEAARQQWMQRLDFEVQSSEMTGRALGNSATARRLAEKQDADSIVGDLVMGTFAGAPPVSLLRQAVGAIPKRIRDTLRSRSDNILAELLTDPQGMTRLREAIDRVSARNAPPSILRNNATISGENAILQD